MTSNRTYSFPLGHIHTEYSLGYGCNTWNEYLSGFSKPLGFSEWQSCDLFYEKKLFNEPALFLSQEFYFHLPPWKNRLYFSLYPQNAFGAAFLTVFTGWYHHHLQPEDRTLSLFKELAPCLQHLHLFYTPKQEPVSLLKACMQYIQNLNLKTHICRESDRMLETLLSLKIDAEKFIQMEHIFSLPAVPPSMVFLNYACHKNCSFSRASNHPRFRKPAGAALYSSQSSLVPPDLTPSAEFLQDFQANSLADLLDCKSFSSASLDTYRYQYSRFESADYETLQKIYPLSKEEFSRYFAGRIKNRHIVPFKQKKIPLPALILSSLEKELVLPAACPNL